MAIPHAWPRAFHSFLTPFADQLDHSKQRHCLKRYVRGLLAPLERKSIQPLADHLRVPYQRLHHFLNVSSWKAEPLQIQIARRAQQLCGGTHSVLIIDDTALPKSGDHSVGVARQYCGVLGKLSNCQSLVTLTLANGRLLVPLALRLFLPRAWTDNVQRCQGAGVPESRMAFRSKGQLALEELDRVRALGVSFRIVLADAGYGTSKDFRQALSQRGLRWAVGIEGHQNAYSTLVHCAPPRQVTRGRPQKYPVPSEQPRPVRDLLGEQPRAEWRRVKGGRTSRWAFARVRIADGVGNARGVHLPGEAVWVVGELRPNGQVKFYATNHPAGVSKTQIVQDLKARWQCETMHTQAKEELGLDHFEGRSYQGLMHHMTLVMLTMLFLQTLRQSTMNQPSEPGDWTLPQARRAFTRVLEHTRFRRCPHCGERIAA